MAKWSRADMEAMLALFLMLLRPVRCLQAFWRLPCSNLLDEDRIEQIVSYGGPSEHIHMLLGGARIKYFFSTIVAWPKVRRPQFLYDGLRFAELKVY